MTRMSEVVETLHVPASPDVVWAVLRDVGGIADWMPGVLDSSVRGDQRTFIIQGSAHAPVVERIISLDDGARRYSYEYLSGPMRLESYLAEAGVSAADDGCTVTWSGRFAVPDPAKEERMRQAIRATYQGVLAALREKCAPEGSA